MARKRHTLDEICSIAELDGRYHVEAFFLVLEGLEFAMRKLPARRHVTGAELLDGIATFLLEEYGPLAYHVLTSWGVKETRDVGEIVFLMIKKGLLAKTDHDSIENFRDVFSFKEVLGRNFPVPDRIASPRLRDWPRK